MDISRYIESGILELYALGLLTADEAAAVDSLLESYKELAEELERIYSALENYAALNAIEPRAGLEAEVLDRIENASREQRMDPGMLPLISRYSDLRAWAAFTGPMLKEFNTREPRSIKILTHTGRLTQILVSSSTDFDWETHDEEYESFLILSGEALCTIGDSMMMMAAGDFMDIPLHVPHSVKLLSPVVTAVLQRQKVR